NVTVEDALNHPTWNMGPKITIDSASLANKGLEVIEANQLFGLPAEKINVVIHPQSYVHSFVQTKDGALYAQISKPDMKHPILNALTYPEIMENSLEKIDFSKAFQMEFLPPRYDDFPMLKLAYSALNKEKSYPIVYNAVNEIAVAAFRNKQIKFTDIAKVTEKVLSYDWSKECETIEEVVQIDYEARNKAIESIKELNCQ
ncbi:MAG: 1-deoxy-D-xylulose-5-phosphate reductoisomerase, partial [Spirochaetaceae bacterium]|nr:1-deoxy-D-xylulose-5-phosphate reductoisomerase [Spirochaetaceae bacterium]